MCPLKRVSEQDKAAAFRVALDNALAYREGDARQIEGTLIYRLLCICNRVCFESVQRL